MFHFFSSEIDNCTLVLLPLRADGPTSAPHGVTMVVTRLVCESLPQGCVEVAYCASGNQNKVNVSFRLIVQSLPFHRGSGMCVVFASARMGCVLRLVLCKSQWLQASG
jgi:hypothetical protein